jgi:hypothetical protein
VCNDALLRWLFYCSDPDDDHRASINSKKSDEREQLLRFHLGVIREDAGRCSGATNAILRCHAQFAKLMAQRIDDASKSRFKGLNYDVSETSRLANDINQVSRELSLYVTNMIRNLTLLVSVLEKIEVTVLKKERTLARRILGWLKSLFKALARIFVTFGPIISPFLHCVAPGVSGIAPLTSTLWVAASAFCGPASGVYLRHKFSCKDKVLIDC